VLKGLLLSVTLMALWLVVQGIVFHAAAPRKAFSSMLGWFAPTVPLYLALYWVTPANLGVLPDGFVGADWRLGLLNGLGADWRLIVGASMRLLIRVQGAFELAGHFEDRAKLEM
jgi:hypothetical protein